MKSLLESLDDFRERKILVLGDIVLDKYTWGRIDSLNPEQPAAPKVRINPEATYNLGGAANVANNVASLTARCKLYGIVGKDEPGRIIANLCRDRNIGLSLFEDNLPTIIKERVMAHGQQVVRLEYGEWELKKISKTLREEVLRKLETEINNYDFLILSDYDKVFFDEEMAKDLIALANSRAIPILVDAKPQNMGFFRNCSIIRVNEKEAEIMAGVKYFNGKGIERIGKKLASLIESRYVVITCGEDGVYGYDRERDYSFRASTKAREVVDVTGAGDTFTAALALGLASRLDIKDAAKLANYAAGNVVEKIGTAVTTLDEIKERILLDKKLYKHI